MLDATRPNMLQWTGLRAVTGLEVAKWSLGTDEGTIDSHFTVLGSQPDEKKTVHVTATGSLSVVSTSGADPGTGLLTVLSLVGAESLDIEPARVFSTRYPTACVPSASLTGACPCRGPKRVRSWLLTTPGQLPSPAYLS